MYTPFFKSDLIYDLDHTRISGTDLIYNMDHTRISGTEPSSVILSKTK